MCTREAVRRIPIGSLAVSQFPSPSPSQGPVSTTVTLGSCVDPPPWLTDAEPISSPALLADWSYLSPLLDSPGLQFSDLLDGLCRE